jgi:hypothetical protein
MTTERAVAWVVTAAVAAFVLWQMFPSLLLRNTTPTQGDLGGHVHEAAYLRDHLLPHFRISGWSPDWFTGYPSLTFYFPLGALLMAVLDLIGLPFNVAVKMVAATGPVALPVCAYAFGRLNRCDRPTSACLAVGTLPLLLQPTLFVAGGSLVASIGGEYSFEMSLALGLVVLGLARRGLETGRHRALTAGLFAVDVLLHLIPAFIVGLGILLSVALRPSRVRLRWTASVVGVAGALTAFWAVPFVLRTKFTAGPEYPKSVPVLTWLNPVEMRPVALLAVVGIVAMFVRDGMATLRDPERRDDLGVFLVVMALLSAVVFALLPTGQVWNGRFLPLWFLWLGLLAAHALARMAKDVDRWRRKGAKGGGIRSPQFAGIVLPVALFLVVLPLWDTRLGRGALTKSRPDATTTAKTFVRGYEEGPDRAEFQDFIDTLRAVGRDHGCGRAHWEWDIAPRSERRIPLNWLIPYWTDGCLQATMGLYTQSSATSPAVDAVNSRLTPAPVVLGKRHPFDFRAGVADLRLLGVRYLIASRDLTLQEADASPDLRLVAQTAPHLGRVTKIYELVGTTTVEPLAYLPTVVPGVGRSRSSWEATAGAWFDRGPARDVVVAADGPETWPRRDHVGELPRRPAGSTTVHRVRLDRDRASFDVSRTGVPVLVKVSYFPNWRVSGAEGPWRVTPNQMVVVPTSKTVTLRYERTAVDLLGWLVTLVGLIGLVFLARVRRPHPPEALRTSMRGGSGRAQAPGLVKAGR